MITITKQPPLLNLTGNQIIFEIANSYTGDFVLDWGITPENQVVTHSIVSLANIGSGGPQYQFLYFDYYPEGSTTPTQIAIDILRNPVGNVTQRTTYIYNQLISNQTLNSLDVSILHVNSNTVLIFSNPGLNLEITSDDTGNQMTITKEALVSDQITLINQPPRLGLNIKKAIQKLDNQGAPQEYFTNLIEKYEVEPDYILTINQTNGNKTVSGAAKFPIEKFISNQQGKEGLFQLDYDKNYNWHKQPLADKYQAFAYDVYPTDPNIESGVSSNIFYAINGKISQFTEGYYNRLMTNFYLQMQSTKPFLTAAPKVKVTDIYMPERLYFFNIFNLPKSFRIHVQVFYDDGTNEAIVLTQPSYTHILNRGECLEIHCGFINVYEYSNQAKKITKYMVWLKDSASETKLSEERTYTMDYTYHSHARYFLWKNSKGAYDVSRFTGKAISRSSMEKTFATTQLSNGFYDTEISTRQISHNKEFLAEIHTGHLTQEWNQYLDEFLESSEVYWLKQGRAYRVQVRPTEHNMQEDKQHIYGFPFNLFVNNLNQDFQTIFDPGAGIPIAGDFNNDFNEDYY